MGVSAREAGKVLGITHTALLKAARSGRVSRCEDGSFDVDTARKQLAENTNALKRRTVPKAAAVPTVASVEANDKPVESGDRTLAEALRQREWIRLQKDDIQLARQRGELAPIAEVNAWVAGMIIRAREILLRVPPELKDRLAQQSNPHECEALVAGEVRRALNELAEFRPTSG